jgi:hypothetical protein
MPGGVAASLVASQSQLLDQGQPARPGGDAGSSARRGRLSAAALSPAPGTKENGGINPNIWIKAANEDGFVLVCGGDLSYPIGGLTVLEEGWESYGRAGSPIGGLGVL